METFHKKQLSFLTSLKEVNSKENCQGENALMRGSMLVMGYSQDKTNCSFKDLESKELSHQTMLIIT